MHELIGLRPRSNLIWASHNHTVLAMGREGFIDEPSAGFFFQGTRLFSRYIYRVDSKPLSSVAPSLIEQHRWLGYYLAPVTERKADPQEAVEVRIARIVGDWVHEDVHITNFSRQSVAFTLELDVDADFADRNEILGERVQKGRISEKWEPEGELLLHYHAERDYRSQNESGHAAIDRAVLLRLMNAGSGPFYEHGKVFFSVRLLPRASWRTCVEWVPYSENTPPPSGYGCFDADSQNEHEKRRRRDCRITWRCSAATR